MAEIRIGCAGWSIPRASVTRFPSEGSHLERYAARLSAVEINSSFSRSHKPETYARWAATVPAHFRFAVKVPKQVTHVSGLTDLAALERFVAEASALGGKLGPFLVQLPPSLSFDAAKARTCFKALRAGFTGEVVCEPRHPTWFTARAEKVLVEFGVARVAAHPSRAPGGDEPAGWGGLVYYRLHGAPRRYHSGYSASFLGELAATLARAARSAPAWCIFDNTASGAATPNALSLIRRVQRG